MGFSKWDCGNEVCPCFLCVFSSRLLRIGSSFFIEVFVPTRGAVLMKKKDLHNRKQLAKMVLGSSSAEKRNKCSLQK